MRKSEQKSAISGQPSSGTAHRAVAHTAAHGRAARRGAVRGRCFTLVEVMVVIAIIAILVVVVAWAGSRVMSDAKVKQTRAVMDTIKLAMAEYAQAHGSAPSAPVDPDDPSPTKSLPPGNDGFRIDFFREPDNSINTYSIPNGGDPPCIGNNSWDAYSVVPDSSAARYKPDQKRIYGIQALYYYLSREPGCKRTLDKIPPVCVAHGCAIDATSGKAIPCSVSGEMGCQNAGSLMATGKYSSSDSILPTRVSEVPILLDAWGRPMYYGWDGWLDPAHGVERVYVLSAGPDGVFLTGDDIDSRKE